MTKEQINKLLADGTFPEPSGKRELIETHISWVIVCDRFVYKIKKPLQYSFLDFSTLEKRKYFCEKEIALNKRLTDDMYLDVQPVRDQFIVGGTEGKIIDYAVRMRKLDKEKQMDVLLLNNQVSLQDMQQLADKIAAFHKSTDIIYQKNYLDVQEQFSDLDAEKEFLSGQADNNHHIISHAMEVSATFIEKHKDLLAARLQDGFFRDCHGDLHARNIFLLPAPQPFDCIEFNDDFRQIDILNEVAFLCMDMDAFGRHDLGDHFLHCYNKIFPAMSTEADRSLFIYYKSYRSNIRAKVNSLRARSTADSSEKAKALSAAGKYLQLMDGYIKKLER